MITSSVGFFTFLITLMAIVFYIEKRYPESKVFKIIPSMVWLMLIVAFAATFGVFDGNAQGVSDAQNFMYEIFLPMMLTMFMLTCDIRNIIKLGPRMILSFFTATFSILTGLAVAFLIMKRFLPASAWGSIAAVTGSFVGETINMVAVASSFGVEGVDYVYAVMMDTIGFTIMLSLAMGAIPHTKWWNQKMKASTKGIDEVALKIESENKELDKTAPKMLDYCMLLSIAMVGTMGINKLIPSLPNVSFLSATGWRVVLSSIIGVLLGLTPAHRLKGAQEVANVLLYLSLCVTMSYSDLSQVTQAPAFIVYILLALALMIAIWVLLCKVFKFDLFTASVGFMANFGGTGSAPAVAATHNPNWISFGILLGFLGDIVGTGIAIAFGSLLKSIAGF